jgi:hypothetical protein
MSRAGAGDVIEVKPAMNVYTALVWVAVVAQLIGFAALYFKSTEIFDKGLF